MVYTLFSKQKIRYHFVHNTNYAHIIDKLITKLSIRNASNIITDSVKTKEFIGVMDKNIYVAPMNISFSNNFMRAFKNDLKFVFIGRFSKVKDIKRSVDFIAYLQSKGLNASFDLYGRDDGEQGRLSSYIIDLGLSDSIQFKGALNPLVVESIMRKYDFYLQTSVYEGMSISVFQSLLNGLIPVVTPVGEISNYTCHKVNAFHLNTNDEISSYDEFISIYNNGFNGFNIGTILHEEQYPIFYKTFFDLFEIQGPL